MRSVAVVLAVLVLAGCTAAPPAPEPGATPKALPQPSVPARTPADACQDDSLTGTATYTAADGTWFETGIVGEGKTVAVFVPQSGANYCGFKNLALVLADRGIQSVLLNLCAVGQTLCPTQDLVTSGADAVLAAADQARANGATRVVAVGASMGGTTVIEASEIAKDSGRLDAVASLSGPIDFQGVNVQPRAGDIAIPMFLAVSGSDSVVSPTEMKDLGEASSSPAWAQYSGFGHGWDMLFLDHALTDTGSKLVAFIAG